MLLTAVSCMGEKFQLRCPGLDGGSPARKNLFPAEKNYLTTDLRICSDSPHLSANVPTAVMALRCFTH